MRFAFKLYELIFHAPPDEFALRFLKNFFFALSGIGISTALTFGVNILVIRQLGPDEFGRWSIVISIAEFLVILPLWGMSVAALHYLGAKRASRQEIVGTMFRVAIVFSALFFSGYFLFSSVIHSIFRVESSLYLFALFYALFLVFFYLFQSFFQGLEQFRKLSFFWVLSSLFFVGIVLFFLFVLYDTSFQGLWWGNIARLSVVIFAGIIVFRKHLSSFNKKMFREIFPYSTFHMLSVFAGFFGLASLDNLMINYYLGPSAVGLYAAYYLGYSVVMSRFQSTFSQVFLPMASASGDIKELYDRIMILMKKMGVLFLAGNFFLVWFLFQLYGKEFSFDWGLAFLIALNTTLYFFLMIISNLIMSRGTRGLRGAIFFAPSAALVNVFLNFLLIPQFGLFGAVIATSMSIFTVFILALRLLHKVFLLRNSL